MSPEGIGSEEGKLDRSCSPEVIAGRRPHEALVAFENIRRWRAELFSLHLSF